eukprot:CAMPEP_0204322332 /NCGR_PEP_ID=MMETSP0469-20131031/8629_1 /ASSEMBLY_ACC=CAM_ASM_000384 /TAXON_ID=2969 /ORGANISM="Oxyrrhis marina" /LENGTH=276 /DNA_ID=CAMNT_0051303671 /DNA_START=51 /DNA_END=881 /DNA_ORIENTATION=-
MASTSSAMWQRVEVAAQEAAKSPMVESKVQLAQGLYTEAVQRAATAQSRVTDLKGAAVQKCAEAKTKGVAMKTQLETRAVAVAVEAQKRVEELPAVAQLKTLAARLRSQAESAVAGPAAVAMGYKAAVSGRLQAAREQGQQTVTVAAAEVMVRAEHARKRAELQLATRAPTVHACLKEFGAIGVQKAVVVVSSIRAFEVPSVDQLRSVSAGLTATVTTQVGAVKGRVLEAKATAVAQATETVQQARKAVHQVVAEKLGDEKAEKLMAWLVIPAYFF